MSRDSDEQVVKCLVWDLDNTLWDGVLLEDESIVPRTQVRDVLETLDCRGILQSIASRNDEKAAMEKLREFGLSEYFLYPQINWNSKAASIASIAKSLNLGLDAIAFVDDQDFERDEVSHVIPQVLCIGAAEIDTILELPQMNPRFITEDSKLRRSMYLSDIERNRAEKEFVGSSEEFLATLNMVFTISPATQDDLQRAEELTVRTHQLNTTGYTFSYDELNAFRTSARHRLFIAGLEDKYGSYGKIGLCLLDCAGDIWTVKLLLMSCRVISRGVGTVMLNYVMALAKRAGARIRAEFISNDRNRMMLITYKFAGFREIEKKDRMTLLESDMTRIQPFPQYLKVRVVE